MKDDYSLHFEIAHYPIKNSASWMFKAGRRRSWAIAYLKIILALVRSFFDTDRSVLIDQLSITVEVKRLNVPQS